MNRHQRRKRALLRKAEKLRHLAVRAAKERAEEIASKNLSNPHHSARSPKGLGNRGIYRGVGMYPTKGYGSGVFKSDPCSMSDGQLRHFKNVIEARANKRKG